jgi:hypothetical protein
MNTQGRKAKGRSLVIEIKQWIHKMFPEFTDHDVIIPATSAPGEDLLLSNQLRQVFPFSVECKRTEGLAQDYKFIEQSKKNAGTNMPIVMMRSNRKPTLVMMYLTDFEKLIGS